MQPDNNIDINAVRQALLNRAQSPAMAQGMSQPMLNQVGKPAGATPTGGSPSITNAPPTISNPSTPQPQFSSPFAGPKQGNSVNFDEETKRVSKTLISKLLQVL